MANSLPGGYCGCGCGCGGGAACERAGAGAKRVTRIASIYGSRLQRTTDDGDLRTGPFTDWQYGRKILADIWQIFSGKHTAWRATTTSRSVYEPWRAF